MSQCKINLNTIYVQKSTQFSCGIKKDGILNSIVWDIELIKVGHINS
jgi:hypothetical protein